MALWKWQDSSGRPEMSRGQLENVGIKEIEEVGNSVLNGNKDGLSYLIRLFSTVDYDLHCQWMICSYLKQIGYLNSFGAAVVEGGVRIWYLENAQFDWNEYFADELNNVYWPE